MPQTSWALSEVQASIDACGTDIRAAELEISKVEEQLASPGLSSEDKAYWRKEKEQLRKEKEQLRKKEEQLRKKEELMLGRAERIEMQATSGACAVFGTRVHLTVHCALIARFSTVFLLLMMVYQ